LADDVGGRLAAEAAGKQGFEGGTGSGRYLFDQARVELGSIEAKGVSQEDFRLQGRVVDAGRREVSGGAPQGLA